MHSKTVDFENAPGGELIIKQQQYIPDEFLSDLRKEREDSLSTPAGEFHRVARIPQVLADKWGVEFMMNAPVAEILKRLRQEQLDAFIASNKV
jgi:hypothetical protein